MESKRPFSFWKMLTIASLIFNVALIAERWVMTGTAAASYGQVTFSEDEDQPVTLSKRDTIRRTTTPWVFSNATYGHVHMAKTAGTEINGYLAARYERVCGHKGYSYDAYQFNLRVKQAQEKTGEKGLSVIGKDDIISSQKKDYNRGRIPMAVMQEIGFEDCDWISVETNASIWRWNSIIKRSASKPLELHVPCRDPIPHLMSQCHHKAIIFNCSAENIEAEVEQCLLHIEERFQYELTRARNVMVKCYNAIPVEPYIEYMESKLQEKRIPAEFIHRESNEPRDKSKECIWKNDKVREEVLELLLKLDYYKFCQECIGGSNDLLAFS